MAKNVNVCDNCPLRETYTEHNSETTVALTYATNGNHEWLSVKGRTIYGDEVGAGISLDSRIGNLLLNNAGNCNGPVLKGRRERRRIRRESIEVGLKVSPDSQCPSLNQIPIEILKAEVNAVASRLEGW